jgi:hypothetical protein
VLAHDLPELDLAVQKVTTVRPERTFWDKVIILHGLRQWHDRREELRHGGQRVSRHYYDVFRLLQADTVEAGLADDSLARDCASHARLSKDFRIGLYAGILSPYRESGASSDSYAQIIAQLRPAYDRTVQRVEHR